MKSKFAFLLLLALVPVVGCGMSAKEKKPDTTEVKPDQEQIDKAMQEAMTKMPQYQQQYQQQPGGAS